MNKFTKAYMDEMSKRAAMNWPSIIKKVKSAIALNAAPVGAAGGGAYLNYDENDPLRSAAIGAISGYGAAHVGQGGARLLPQTAKWKPMRAGVIGTSMLAGDIIIPQGREMMRASKERDMAETANLKADLKLKEESTQLNPPVPVPAAPVPAPAPAPAAPAPAAPAPVTINTPSKQDINFLIPGGPAAQWAAGLTALGLSAAGIYALSQIARANKRKADGKETPPVTNINMTGGGGEGGAPGAPAGPAALSAGTLRVTLPTRGGKDNETQVEMPLEQIGLSKTLINKIRRDTKRRLRSESDGRTLHVVPPVTAATKIARFTRRPLNFDHILKRADSTGLDNAPLRSSPPSTIPKPRATSPSGRGSAPAVIKPGIVRPAKPEPISSAKSKQFKDSHGTNFDPDSRVDREKLKLLPPIKEPQPPKAPEPAAPAPAAPAPLSATPAPAPVPAPVPAVPYDDPYKEYNDEFKRENDLAIAAADRERYPRGLPMGLESAREQAIQKNKDISAQPHLGFQAKLPLEPGVRADSGYPGMSLTPSHRIEIKPAQPGSVTARINEKRIKREDGRFLDNIRASGLIPLEGQYWRDGENQQGVVQQWPAAPEE